MTIKSLGLVVPLLVGAFVAGTRAFSKAEEERPHLAASSIGPLLEARPLSVEDVRELRNDMRELRSSITDLNTRLSHLEGAK